MALVECYECSKQMSDIASACPGCGAPHPRPSRQVPQPQGSWQGDMLPRSTPAAPQRTVGFWLGLGVFLLPFIFAWFLLRSGHSTLSRIIGIGWMVFFLYTPYKAQESHTTSSSSYTSSSSIPKPSAEDVRAVEKAVLDTYTAAQIASAYSRNTVAADQTFKGKEFKVSGTIASINTDFLGKPYVTLKGGVNQFMEPQFKFRDGQESEIAKLQAGSKVSLVCTGRGDIAKIPMSDKCEFF